jgi:DMSO/TMAO reductase YedYZ molybdopterin-dependent catalytic subunit
VSGLVSEPRSFNLADLFAFPQATLEGRMKCVECWSVRAKWGGFTYQTLADLVSPKPEARYLRVECADGYWETAAIDDMKNSRAIFATHLNDQPLPDEYGAPLRLMLLWKYGYKSAKAITSISFTAEGGDGYWSSGGAYTIDGDIEPGYDHPLDLDDKAHRIEGGEITEY